MKRKTFLLRPLRELSLRQRLVHTLITVGFPVFILEILFLDYSEMWEVNILAALLGGIITSIVVALIEHILFSGKRR